MAKSISDAQLAKRVLEAVRGLKKGKSTTIRVGENLYEVENLGRSRRLKRIVRIKKKES